jgi:hypothetical protein
MEDLMAHEDEELELDEVARRFETVKAHEIREPDSISLTSSRSKSPELDNIKVEIFLEQREVTFLSPRKI